MSVPVWRRALLRDRVAAGVEHRIVLQQLGALRTVVDIGANRGQFALAARHAYPDAQIISFEPLIEAAAAYRSVFEDDPLTVLQQVAIGPRAGAAIIHVSLRDDSSSLLPIASMQNILFPGTEETRSQRIVVGPLADYLEQGAIEGRALLKLDVQGFELQALLGCEERLDRFAWVYVECSFMELYEGQAFADEVIAWLRDRGFVLRGIYCMVYDHRGRSVQADFLFERSS